MLVPYWRLRTFMAFTEMRYKLLAGHSFVLFFITPLFYALLTFFYDATALKMAI